MHDCSCLKKLLFSLYFILLFNVFRENILSGSWTENASIVFFNWVELITFGCRKNIIYIIYLDVLRLGAMLALYVHYTMARVLEPRPNTSRERTFFSFWSESFVTGSKGGNDSSIHRLTFSSPRPLVSFDIVPLKGTWRSLSLKLERNFYKIVTTLFIRTMNPHEEILLV